MMPLCTTVTPEPSQASIGCALASITPPCVAQRVWARPLVAGWALAPTAARSTATLPTRRVMSTLPLIRQMPAES